MKNFISALKEFYATSKIVNVKYKKLRIFTSAFLSNLIVGLDLLIILFFASFFSISESSSIEYLYFIFEKEFLLPLFVVLRFVCVYLDTMNIHHFRLLVERNLREDILKDIFKSGNYSISDSYFYINTLSPNIGGFYQYLTTLFGSTIQFFLFSAYLLFDNSSLFIYFIFGGFLLLFPGKVLIKKGRYHSHLAYTYNQEMNAELENVVDNLFLIKILKKVKEETLNFSLNLGKYYKSQINNQKFGTINAIMPQATTTFILSIFVLVSSSTVLTLDFIGVLFRLFQSYGTVNKNLSLTTSTYVHLEKLKLIEDNKEKVNIENFKHIKEQNDDYIIKFENVDYKFLSQQKNIFSNLNFKIKKGTYNVIVGPNGSGKSTILGLISGVFYPVKGKVKLNALKVGYVSTNPMIIRNTLKHNILYGIDNLEISDEDILKWVEKFELFTGEGENLLEKEISNKSLSSGQMQKISFIRALISNIDLLILDEATANLDDKSKKLIFNILSEMDITIVNSTHNIDEFSDFDKKIKILPVEDGPNLLEVS